MKGHPNKKKYKFNAETLRYEKIEFSFKRFFVRLVPYIVSSALFGGLIMFLYIVVFESPEEKFLRRENEFLQQNLRSINERLAADDEFLDEVAQRDNYIYRTTFEQDSIPSTLREAGVGGADRYRKLNGYESTFLVKDVAKKLDRLEHKLNIQSLSFRDLMSEMKKREISYSRLPVLQPIHVNQLTRIGSFFGYRMHPILHIVQLHHGLDLVASRGTPVYASGDGVVSRVDMVGKRSSGYGNCVFIDHGVNGLSSRYAHMQTVSVQKGDRVKRGQQIGTVGSTGLSTAPHLHYEILVNGSAVNPLRFMVTPTVYEYEKLLQNAKYDGISFD